MLFISAIETVVAAGLTHSADQCVTAKSKWLKPYMHTPQVRWQDAVQAPLDRLVANRYEDRIDSVCQEVSFVQQDIEHAFSS